MKTKLKGFTVMEVMITLILTGIVVSFGYLSFQMFSGYSSRISDISEKLSQTAVFDNLLKHDIVNARTVTIESGGSNIVITQNNDKIITYSIETDAVIRVQTGVEERFEVEVKSAEFMFDGQPVTSGFIDECNFTVLYNEKPINFTYTKQYSAATYMELDYQKNGFN